MSRVVAAKKPCCKVCMDAGKSVEEYSSHWVKDTKGTVICPTLLSQQCRYCIKSGHTVKFCPTLKANEKEREKKAREFESKKTSKKEVAKKETKKEEFGVFTAFAYESDDEVEVQEKEDVNFPALSKNVTLRPHQQHFVQSYASKAAKMPPIQKPVVSLIKPSVEEEDILKQSATTHDVKTPTAPRKMAIKRSWADDYSDSDSDDE